MPTSSRPKAPKRVLWPHTGVTAPSTLKVRHYRDMPTHDGVAFTATLVHPKHGPIGTIENSGNGGATFFYPNGNDTFRRADMDTFVAACNRDGVAIPDEQLFAYILIEHEYTRAWAKARRAGRTIVRSVGDDSDGLPSLGEYVEFSAIALDERVRTRLAEQLEDHPTEIYHSHWEIYLGDRWVNLADRLTPTPDAEQAARHACLYTVQAGKDLRSAIEGWTLLGLFPAHGTLVWELVETGPEGARTEPSSAHEAWCRCRTSAPVQRFERWTVDRRFLASGAIHGCGGLVRMD